MSPRSTHAYRPLSLKRRTWLTLGAVVLGGAGAVTVAVAAQPDGRGTEARPAKVRSLPLEGTGSTKRQLPRTETELFSMLGVSWQGATKRLHGTAEIRTHNTETGEWTGWRELDLDQHLPDRVSKNMRGVSDPLWVGPSDAVQARVAAADGSTSGLPKGLRLDLVDPGVTAREARTASRNHLATGALPGGSFEAAPVAATSETPTATPGDTTTPAPTASAAPTDTATATPSETVTSSPSETASPTPTVPPAPPSTVTRPPIVSRAQWGADESRVDDPPEYIEAVKAVFVHHTVGTNNYSCADSPALARGIFEYHVETNGWNDLGYNFLVDKCGTVFEGRAGGVDLPVKGAHTYGFNSDSAGIAVLGDFQSGAGKPTRQALEAVARVAAWKLGQYGGDPSGEVTLTAAGDTGVWNTGDQATLKTVSGHRDGFATECPGDNLYAKLPEIRRFASSKAVNAAAATADVDRNGIDDLVAGTPSVSNGAGALSVVPGGTDGPVAAATRVLTQNSPGVPGGSESGDGFGADTAWGDLDNDGYADLVVGAPGENLSTSTDTGMVTVLRGPGLDTGSFYEIPGHTGGEKLGSSVATGDFNSDGHADVFAVAPGKPGRWWSFDGKSAAATSGYLGSGAYIGAVSSADSATGDFDRDGYTDVVVNFRDPDGTGRVLVLKGSATGLKRVGILGVKGGRSVAVGDIDADGYADAVVGQPYTAESDAHSGGQVTALYGSSAGLTTTGRTTIHQSTSGVPGAAEAGDAMGMSVSVGDFDLDGYADVLAGLPREDLTRSGTSRTDAGAALLMRGTASGLTGTGAQAFNQDTSGIPGASESGDRLGSAVVLHDLSGWSRADLAIGADGENAGDGTVLQLDSGSSGVSVSGAVYYNPDDVSTPTGAALGGVLLP
ncbi:FG-GAP-like repeat-containing protein [Streptomyces meridianus]|uniref:FG-GAP-like repeat-containing protein n=1 Tax=Streptomyces meridianus TaxID=2938945 RepID=A0ABT0X5W7_9ACTN|nr:FG-GAP-like repeat-containing protein [Streptomyces meridianus]MCM2577927.1 FG-GAP-like repeat-containing protein [Streptomyces meridianus]